jgi:hypothetical protein
MVALIVGLGLSQIGRRILHEVRLGLLIAEAIGLALVLGIHRAVGLDLLVQSEAFRILPSFSL